jgi:hypothetical protein
LRDGLFKIGRLSKPAVIFSDALDHRFQTGCSSLRSRFLRSFKS